MTSATEETMENGHVIYLAGGCFWGLEKLMQSIPGVTDAVSGYANGTGEEDANYKTVGQRTNGLPGDGEGDLSTPSQVSLDALLLAYFYVIDPTVENRQGNDVGSQYQTGRSTTRTTHRRKPWSASPRWSGGAGRSSLVEIGPLVNFFPAEEYHQDYLDKNPNGYCHIPRAEIESVLPVEDRSGRRSKARRRGHPGQADRRAVPGTAGKAPPNPPSGTNSGTSSRRGSTWTWSPASRCSPPRTSSRAAAAGPPSPEPIEEPAVVELPDGTGPRHAPH